MDTRNSNLGLLLSVSMRVELVFPFFIASNLTREAQAIIALGWIVTNFLTERRLEQRGSKWWRVLCASAIINSIFYGGALAVGANFVMSSNGGFRVDDFKLRVLAKLVFGVAGFLLALRFLAHGIDVAVSKFRVK